MADSLKDCVSDFTRSSPAPGWAKEVLVAKKQNMPRVNAIISFFIGLSFRNKGVKNGYVGNVQRSKNTMLLFEKRRHLF
jgi:hypothetical protein